MRQLNLSFRSWFVSSSLLCLLLASCSKDVVNQPAAPSLSSSATEKTVTASDAISISLNPNGVLGDYTSHSEKTLYIGQANSTGSNVLLHLNYINLPKTMKAADDKKHLTTPFGASDSYEGWQYIIGYNVATKQLVVTPNAAMTAAIVPGSFESLQATYSPSAKTWSFVTRFTALTDNGNETQINETFWKE